MEFCTQCGNQRGSSEKFCRKCGFPFPNDNIKANASLSETEPTPVQTEPAQSASLFSTHPPQQSVFSSTFATDGDAAPMNEPAPLANLFYTPATQPNLFEAEPQSPLFDEQTTATFYTPSSSGTDSNVAPLGNLFNENNFAPQNNQDAYTQIFNPVASPANAEVPPPAHSHGKPPAPVQNPYAPSAPPAQKPTKPEPQFHQNAAASPPMYTAAPPEPVQAAARPPANPKMQSVFNSVQESTPQNARPSPPPLPVPTQEAPARRGGRAVVVVLCIVLGLLLFAAATFAMLYVKNSPDKLIDKYITAISDKDVATLDNMTNLLDISAEQVDWNAFTKSFENEGELEKLKTQLDGTGTNPYAALKISEREEKLFGLITQYAFTLNSVELNLPEVASSSKITLGSKSYTTEASQNNPLGSVVKNLMPGIYSLIVFDQNGAGTEQTVSLWSSGNITAPPTPGGTEIQISNCMADDSDVFVNETFVSDKPANGTLTMQNVSVGSVVKIVSTVNSEAWAAYVTITEGENSYSFLNYEKIIISSSSASSSGNDIISPENDPKGFAAAASVDTIKNNLSLYYRSYLNCLNSQNISVVEYSTTFNNSDVAERMAKDFNKNKSFDFVEILLSQASLVTAEDSGRPALLFNATFKFTYVEDGTTKDSSNIRTMQMVYEDGQWKVNRMTSVSAADYTANKLADFPK